MLKELRINNFAIIDNLTIDFTKGLNILTGETGSGKSIIIEALEMVLGGRANRHMIRSGKDKAVIEAMFILEEKYKNQLKELGFEIDDVLVLTKEISNTYPSISRINGRPVTLNVLKSLTTKIVDIFGQHEHQSLLDVENHILIIDSLLLKEGKELLNDVEEDYNEFRNLNQQLNKLTISSQEREREIDLLKFQIEEIDDAKLIEENDENIEHQFKRMDNLKEIISQTSHAISMLNDDYEEPSALPLIEKSIGILGDVGRYDQELKSYGDILQGLLYEFNDISRSLSNYIEGLEIDEEKLYVLRERLDVVNNLKKKYGVSVQEVLTYRDDIQQRYDTLLNLDSEISNLNNQINIIKNRILMNSTKLTSIRKDVAKKLQKAMERELQTLNMESVKFEIDFKIKKEPSLDGLDLIEFLLSTNPGEDVKSLSKIVSGGEMSRIMLAFKGILADMDQTPTLVFDEIDTGISGRTAQVVGEKIRRISVDHQVISISHLPQIAALADTHFVIRKDSNKERNITKVEKLNEKERVEELARILGGVEVTELTRKHALEMLQMSNKMNK